MAVATVAYGIAVDAAGNAYVTGYTTSADFPTVNAFQPTLGGSGATNAFVASLDPTGQQLRYSTYLGGSSFDDGFGIAVDQSGHVYVTGETNSDDFPTLNAFQPIYRGNSALGPGNAFVTSLDAAGQPVYSTYLGGSGDEQGLGIAVDQNSHAYVTGITTSPDFPTLNAFQPMLGGLRGADERFRDQLRPHWPVALLHLPGRPRERRGLWYRRGRRR